MSMTTMRAGAAEAVTTFVECRQADDTFTLHDVLRAAVVPVDVEHVVTALWDFVEDGVISYRPQEQAGARFVVVSTPADLPAHQAIA